MTSPSPFLLPFVRQSQPSALSILHLSRSLLEPVILDPATETHDGYLEGRVVNTRFGSFTHSALLEQELGAQVRASDVDTGRRGRRVPGNSRKRKREDSSKGAEVLDPKTNGEAETIIHRSIPSTPTEVNDVGSTVSAVAVEAPSSSSGFAHLLPPTPELWTAALPHRTQVVYTPDYSYIIQRLRVRPGSRIIEAGAGSGSFTHAAARAVYDGHTQQDPVSDGLGEVDGDASKHGKLDATESQRGKVWSYEFHEQRAASIRKEIKNHGLGGIVKISHQDVCDEGFSIPEAPEPILANAVFLDLPAPWLALPHLTRQFPASSLVLDPKTSIHICTFSPCIEQVQRTVSTLRSLGWLEISMVEIAAKRIETRRERVGLCEEGLKGANASPANVDEALKRLKEVEGRTQDFHQGGRSGQQQNAGEKSSLLDKDEGAAATNDAEENEREGAPPIPTISNSGGSKSSRLQPTRMQSQARKLFKEGRLVTRDEQALKAHTSYLVFAVLPREWGLEDELEIQRKLPEFTGKGAREDVPLSKRQMKKKAAAAGRQGGG